MATNNDDIKWLYGKLKARGYNVGTEQEFTSSLANEADRQWYYEKAKGMGLNMGSMADFNSLYAPARTTNPTASTQQRTASATASAARPAAPGKATPKYSSWPAGTPGNPVKPTSAPVAKDYNPAAVVEKALYGKDNYIPQVTPFETPEQRKNRRETMRKVAYPTPQEKKEAAANLTKERAMSADGTRLEWLELKARQGGLSEAEKKEYNALATDEVSRTRSASDKRMQEQVERSKRLTDYSKSSDGDFTRRKYDPVRYGYGLNPQTGILEAQYLTHDGRIVFGESGKIQAEAEAIPFREQMERKDELEEMEARMAEIDEELKELRHQKDEAENGDVEGESFLDKFVRIVGGNASRGYGVPGTVKDLPPELTGVARTDLDQRIHDLQNEYLLLDRAHTMKLREQEKGGWEFGRDMLHGAKDAFTWNLFGDIIDISLAADAWSASKKDNRTDSQDRMLEAFVKKSEYDSHDKGIGYHLTNLPLSFMSDPLTYASGGIGSIAGKGAEKIVKKVAVRQAEKAIGSKVGKWVVEKALTTRLLPATVGSAVNLGVYNAGSSMRDQYIATGEVNSGEVLKSSAIGVGTGIILGPMGSIVGNVGDKAVRSTSSIAGKMAIRGVQYPVSTVLEGTVFAIPGWMSGEGDPMDVWVEGMATAAGFKGTHAIKSAPRVIRGLKGDGRRIGKGVEERVRDMLDRDIPEDMQLTKDELAEIRDKGYGRLADLFRKRDNRVYEVDEKGKKHFIGEAEEGSNENVREIVKPGEESGKHDFKVKEAQSKLGEDGYDVMEEFIGDSRVSQATRAKAYWLLTGHRLAPSPIIGYREYTLEDGRHFVEAVAVDGNVVTLRQTKPGAETKREVAKIKRQAELNGIQVGEWFAESEANRIRYGVALEEVSREYGSTPERIAEVYNRVKEGKGQTTDAEQKLVEKVDEALEHAGSDPRVQERDPENIRHRIEEELEENYIFKKKKHDYVEVDNALRKPIEKRSEREQEAVEQYLKELYGGREWRDAEENEAAKPTQEQNAAPTQAEEEARSRYEQGRLLYGRFEEGDETAQADIDAIALRMQEAYDILNEAFGAEAEYYIYQVNKNPWRLVNDPELTIERRDAVLYYINAKAAIDGVMDASNEATDRKRVEVRQSVAKRTHKDNGVIIPATMKVDDRPVYVVKGEVVMFPDGTAVDVRNSSESIIVMDAQTGEYEFTSPDQIFQVSEAVNPQDELDTALSVIEQEQMNIFGDNAVAPEDSATDAEEPQQDEIAPFAQPAEAEAPATADTSEYDRGYEQGLEEAAKADDAWIANLIKIYSQNTPESMSETMKGQLDAYIYEQQRRAQAVPNPAENPVADAETAPETIPNAENGQQTALSRIPLNEKGEPSFESVDKETAWDGLVEAVGGEDDAVEIALAQVQQATADLEALNKKPPTMKAPKLKGSPMAMAEAKRKAAEQYQNDLAQYNQQIAEAQARIDAWNGIVAVHNSRKAELRRQQEDERRQRDAIAHDEAVARFKEEQRIKAEKQAEQERVGVHAVNPKIKDKWDAAAKVEGNADAITLPDGSTLTGRYVLTEAGAASPSHDVNNAYQPTEGFPIDENGQSVNDRDYMHDKDAQQIVEGMASSYDNRALQDPVIVSKDGVVLSGNNRTMSGDLAAGRGTDKAYVDYLAQFGHKKFGFTPEQVAGMKNPRVVFVPDEALPYDATTFARFNAQEKKSQGKPEAAVKLGKIVPDNVFNSIVNDISHYDRLSDYYANEKAVAQALGALMQAKVINDKQLPEMRTGTALSAAGKELIENTLIGKVFQASPDAVRQIISVPTLRQSIVMGLSEIANNHTLARNGYDISDELAKAVDLVARAKTAMPDVYTDGMPVSPFGRMQGLFDDEFGDSRVTDATTLLLADILNSGRPSDLRKILTTYNNEASQASGGQMDMFSGSIPTKEEILTTVNEHFRNATPKEQQALVDAAIAERKRRAEADAEQRERSEPSEQTPNDDERSAVPQQPTADGGTELEPLAKDRNDIHEDTPEEAALRARISVGDEWEEKGPAPDKPIYKRKLYVDGKYEVIQTDAPDKNGSYTGSQLTFDGRDFGDLKEIADYIDGGMQAQQAEPTEAQKAAGNYKMEHRRVDGYNISIENAKGSVRRGTGADGKPWETLMHNDYGYIRGTEGVDGDHIDVFLSDTPEEGDVFVVDQVNKDGSFDEHKVMYGFPTEQAARDAYLSNYEPGWTGLGAITHVSKDEFKKWIQSSRRKTKPFAEYKSVKPIEGNGMIGRSLTDKEATELIERMEATAEIAPTIELTPENWIAHFGEDGTVETPIGIVKMGANQLLKLYSTKRTGYFGMIHPTLNIPDVILEEADPKEGSERDSKYLFVKTFVKSDGSRIVHFESVTVKKDGMEVSISSHEIKDKSLKNKMQNDIVLHLDEKLSPSSELHLTEAPSESEGPDLVPTSDNIVKGEEREDGQLLILPSESSEEAGTLSGPTLDSPTDRKVNTLPADKQAESAESFEPYTITATTYTNKKGKTSDVHLVKFNRELTSEEKAALDTFIREPLTEGKKTSRGWYDRKQGGYMMRSEEAARQLAEMIGNEEAVADAQPMTAEELREAVAPAASAEKKPARKPKKAPINRVSLEDVMTDLSTKGETKLSDHAEPVKSVEYKEGDIVELTTGDRFVIRHIRPNGTIHGRYVQSKLHGNDVSGLRSEKIKRVLDSAEIRPTTGSKPAEPVKAESEQQHEISDEEMQSLLGDIRGKSRAY